MADDIANILIRLGADTSEGDKKLEEVRKELERFGIVKETAEAHIEVKGEDKLTKALGLLNTWDHTRATATAEVKVDEGPLEAALRKVKEFGASRTQVPGISPPSAPSLGTADSGADEEVQKLGRLRRSIDDLKDHFHNFFAPVGRGFDDLRGRSSLLDKGVDILAHGVEDAVTKFGPALKKATEGFASFLDTIGGSSGVIGGSTSALAKAFRGVAESGPQAIGGIIALAALAAAAINALIATVLALGASLAAAAGGVVALGIAFAAALGPAVLVAIGVFKQLSDVIQAVSTGRAASAKQTDALKAATLQQQAAQLGLTRATTSGNKSAVDAIQQQKDAVLALANAYLGLQSAKLGVTDAALALEKANLALKQFKASLPAGLSVSGLIKKAQNISVTGGGPQDATPAGAGGGSKAAELQFDELQQAKARALLGVKEAAQRVADATNNYAKAQVAVTGGLGGTTQATSAATAAANRLEKANIAVQRAQLAVDKAKGTDQVNSLSKAGKDLVPIFTKLADVVKATFGPAIDAVLHSIGVAAKALLPLIAGLKGPFKELGKVMGDALLQIVAALSTPEMQTTFKELIKDSGLFIKAATPGFIALLKIFLLIAKDAMPALLIIMKKFGDLLGVVVKHPKELNGVIQLLVNSFRAWGGLILQVFITLGKFIGLAAPLGNGLVKQITALVKRFGDFLSTKKGRDEVTKWLKDGIKAFKEMVAVIVILYDAISPVIKTLIRMGNFILQNKGLVAALGFVAKNAFEVILAPVNAFLSGLKSILDFVNQIIDQIKKIKLPNLTGSVSVPILGNINPFHASGGVATKATAGVFGEAGPEAILPLTDRVFAQLGAAIAPNLGRSLSLPGKDGGKHVTQNNQFNIKAPGGHAPDTNHFMAEIENRLDALGAVA